eukprot:CAMPEP_0114577832 /NCGR_PEP_ID=MMETSP0125-20121206/2442_1 /TAXON_ID=485358 ORGANISM="Aristerostoma sp., Strain ATCC 50986" /NCGR_SAMPLE_ID=MMETSP0125 /ASSEMBLY_ACC=CAM_ASM_000245 /LENGTH=105 /DNA_ID=CAMNT_0001767437 /DNA_START=316 /DNA_END=630 /DNA_ORIENTATION=+
MIANNLPPVIGIREIIAVAAVTEIASFKTYMDDLNWRKSLDKINPNYEISDIFSVHATSLISHSTIVRRRYPEWSVDYDFIMRGPNYENGIQVFVDILIKYAIWL